MGPSPLSKTRWKGHHKGLARICTRQEKPRYTLTFRGVRGGGKNGGLR